MIEVETLEGDELALLLGPAENRTVPDEETAVETPTEPPASSTPDSDESEDEAPQGQPGLAWGQSNAAEPADSA